MMKMADLPHRLAGLTPSSLSQDGHRASTIDQEDDVSIADEIENLGVTRNDK